MKGNAVPTPKIKYTAPTLMFRFRHSILVSHYVWSQNALVRVGNPRKMNNHQDWDYGMQYTQKHKKQKVLEAQFSLWNRAAAVCCFLNTWFWFSTL